MKNIKLNSIFLIILFLVISCKTEQENASTESPSTPTDLSQQCLKNSNIETSCGGQRSSCQANCTRNNQGLNGAVAAACYSSCNVTYQSCLGLNHYDFNIDCNISTTYTNPSNGSTGETQGNTSAGGDSTGGTSGGISTPPQTNPWAEKYPLGVPDKNCSPSYGDGFDTLKATVSIQGGTFYNPSSPIASQYMYTSSSLMSVQASKVFFSSSDLALQVRFRPLPQPKNTPSKTYCYIPESFSESTDSGYIQLKYNLVLEGKNRYNETEQKNLGTYSTDLNKCSPSLDLSTHLENYADGFYLVIQSVEGISSPDGEFKQISSNDCWTMEIEIANDGTKKIN